MIRPHPRRLRIEYILLVIAVLNFSVTEFCKQKALNKFFELDEFFERKETHQTHDTPPPFTIQQSR